MKTFRKYSLLLLLLLLSVQALASTYPQRFRKNNVSEETDLRVDALRHRMDSIRRHRPTVALVLAGGGAKGTAHVGVIRYLESIGMPVDVVLGTSMGGLVGGIYALGYNPDQMDTIVRTMDWDSALSDKIPRDYLSYSTIKYKEKYALSFPFYYAKKDFYKIRQNEEAFPHKSGELHLGAGGDDATTLVKDNLLGSLPSGMVYGQNVNNIISSLTVGYQGQTDFFNLPIPFVCVATDLVSGSAKIWTQGEMNTALRSTMSIPGLFTPIKTKGMVLVDGGMRNNYPTDLAKKLGADIVIGVDLSSGYKDYSQINNIGDIINTGIDMLGRESFETNINIPDVKIRPDLHEYGMMSFDRVSVDTIIQRGYMAALAVAPQLDSIKRIIGPDTLKLQSRPARDIKTQKVFISSIEISGVDDTESRYLMNKLKIHAGDRVDKSAIDDAAAVIFGTNTFDYVNFELLGNSEPYRLRFLCKKGPINKLGIGARFDTEEIVSILVNVGVGVQKLKGSSVDLTARIGANPSASAVYSYVSERGMTLNAAGSLRYTDRNTFSIGTNRFRINFLNARTEVYLSSIRLSKFFIKTGIRNDYFNISSMMAEQAVGDYDFEQRSNNYISFFINRRKDSFDNSYIPTVGTNMGFSYEWVFGGYPKRFNNFHALGFDAKKVFGGDVFAVIPSVDMRVLLGKEVPVPYTNVMGGSLAGRYIEQQMPFIGINNAAAMKSILGIARADFRFKLFKNNYITAIANYAIGTDEFKSFKTFNTDVDKFFGCGLQYTYNTIVGPIRGNIHWSDYSKTLGAYLSLGFDF